MTAAAPVTVVFRVPEELREARAEAEKRLLQGRETVLHGHAAYAQTTNHSYCEWFVLDWHEEEPPVPEWAQMRQIIVISPPPLEAEMGAA